MSCLYLLFRMNFEVIFKQTLNPINFSAKKIARSMAGYFFIRFTTRSSLASLVLRGYAQRSRGVYALRTPPLRYVGHPEE